MSTGRPDPAAGGRRRGFSPLRDLPSTLWLMAAGISLALQHWITAPQWLVIHLVVLGAASHSILVWSRYFAFTLLKVPPRPSDQRQQNIRLLLLNLGTLAVVTGVLGSWPVSVIIGATAVATAAAWHGWSLARQLRASLSVRLRMVIRYYITAACLLPIGALLGTLLATGDDLSIPARMLVSHVVTNAFGWLGITVAGTIVTLWPTALRTGMVAGADRAAARALPWLVGGVLATDVLALLGSRAGASITLLAYLVGVGILATPFVRTLRGHAVGDIATASLLAGVSWFALLVVYLDVTIAVSSGWDQVDTRLSQVTPAIAAGFALQMLIGAMSYLLPVALGGGTANLRFTNAYMDRGGPLRLVLVNGGLLLALLPAPGLVHAFGWALVTTGVVVFLALIRLVGPASRRHRAALEQDGSAEAPVEAEPMAGERRRATAVVGVAVIAIAAAVGVGLTPTAPASTASTQVVPTGATTTVHVVTEGMRFVPGALSVPVGNRLIVLVHNADPTTAHDLVFPSGATSGMLAPGANARVDAGVIGESEEAWCSVPGHRQMGMLLQVTATGAARFATRPPATSTMPTMPGMTSAGSSTQSGTSAASHIDLARTPDASFQAHPASLPRVPPGTVHHITLTVETTVREVAPGVKQQLWTYNGSMPGPVLHGRIGDTFDITLVNHTTMGHSIDFHAGEVAPDAVMRTVPPGGTLHYTFTATHAGIWMYHCSTMPMSVHIANGMFGAVILDPPGLAPVAHEYVLLQSELYLGAQGGPVDADKVMAERPDLVVFNGYADQYVSRPLTARVGERVRVWVLDAGPDRSMSFHVVGGQFDTSYLEGTYLLHPGAGASQALGLQVAQGGFVELSFRQPGHYSFVTHRMVDAERGARGMFVVTR